MLTGVEPRRPWGEVLRRAGGTTVRSAPWLWLTGMFVLVIERAWTLKAVGHVTVVAVELLPVLFLIAVAVQRLPRSWYRTR
jgi:hypothetical protein